MAGTRDLSRQLSFDLATAPRFGAETFAVGTANETAAAFLARWPDWPAPVAVLVGPPASGKSHLAALWAARAGARTVSACDLTETDPLHLAESGSVVVEDVGPGVDETTLFHLLNAVRSTGAFLLVTARLPPARWQLAIPDLISRLRAAVPLSLDDPDDVLLEAVLAKLFADRQTIVDPAVLRYLARRMERSFAAARALVDTLDREALAAKAPISRALAQRVLERDFSIEPELPGLDIPDHDENNLS